MSGGLCSSCVRSIWCPTWTQWKCKAKKQRMHGPVSQCSSYKKRGKDFKEPSCQCKDCLVNEALLDELEED